MILNILILRNYANKFILEIVKMSIQQRKFKDIFQNYSQKLNKLKNQRLVKFAIPFLILVVGGSFGLKEWTQIRYQFSNIKGVSNEEAEKMGLKKTKKVSLESVYKEIETLDIDNWENKRGPRAWEETVPENK